MVAFLKETFVITCVMKVNRAVSGGSGAGCRLAKFLDKEKTWVYYGFVHSPR